MAKKKYDNEIDEWFSKNHNWKIFLGVAIGIILMNLLAYGQGDKDCGNSITDDERAEIEVQLGYEEKTMRLVNKTGLPNQYYCEELRFMISTDTIPPEVSVYNCKTSPEVEEQWCRTHTNYENKQTFKDYFILNCLEVKA